MRGCDLQTGSHDTGIRCRILTSYKVNYMKLGVQG